MYDADKIACENAHELFSKTSRVGYRISRELGKVSWAFSILMRKKDSHEKNEILMSEKPHEKYSSDFENSHEKVIFSWESHEILMRKQKLTRIFVRDGSVRSVVGNRIARPKSHTFREPSLDTRMLSNFMSRWTTWWSRRNFSAQASCLVQSRSCSNWIE